MADAKHMRQIVWKLRKLHTYNIPGLLMAYLCAEDVEESDVCILPEASQDNGPSRIMARWTGEDLCIDTIIEYFDSFGAHEVSDFDSRGSNYELVIAFVHNASAKLALQTEKHTVRDERGTMYSLNVRVCE